MSHQTQPTEPEDTYFFSKELDERLLSAVAEFFVSVLEAGTAFFRRSKKASDTGTSIDDVSDSDADNVVPFR